MNASRHRLQAARAVVGSKARRFSHGPLRAIRTMRMGITLGCLLADPIFGQLQIKMGRQVDFAPPYPSSSLVMIGHLNRVTSCRHPWRASDYAFSPTGNSAGPNDTQHE
jgi:hypothetical protein